jgi:hypothetical protein
MTLSKTLHSILIICIFLSIKMYAQVDEIPFRGGDHDGFSSSIRNNLACAVGSVLSPFSGGSSEGNTSSAFINEDCPAGLTISPFSGGDKEGFAMSQQIDKSCPAGLSVSAFSGGDKDGFAYWRRVQNNCDGLNSTVTNVTPLEVCQGDSILITGTLLSDVDYIEFTGAYTNQFNVIDSTQIRSLVPVGAQSGSVTVTGPNGTVSSSQQVIINPLPVADFSFEQADGLTFNFTSSNPVSVSHQWDFGDGNTSQLQNPTHTYSVEGIYDVTLSVSNECGNDESAEELTAINVGIISSLEPNVKIYPNPFNSQINLEILLNTQENIKINIYNLMGQLLWSENISGQREIFRTVDLDAFAKGIYFINIQSNSQIISRKIVKQ